MIDKARAIAAFRARVDADLDAADASHKKAMEGATHEEARPEHDKDTRATEASYLARGLARRVNELREVAAALLHPALERAYGEDDPIAIGALVTVADEDDTESHFLVAGAGGGVRIELDGETIRIVTPESPLGAALLGAALDDEVTLRTPKGPRTVDVVGVA